MTPPKAPTFAQSVTGLDARATSAPSAGARRRPPLNAGSTVSGRGPRNANAVRRRGPSTPTTPPGRGTIASVDSHPPALTSTPAPPQRHPPADLDPRATPQRHPPALTSRPARPQAPSRRRWPHPRATSTPHAGSDLDRSRHRSARRFLVLSFPGSPPGRDYRQREAGQLIVRRQRRRRRAVPVGRAGPRCRGLPSPSLNPSAHIPSWMSLSCLKTNNSESAKSEPTAADLAAALNNLDLVLPEEPSGEEPRGVDLLEEETTSLRRR